MCTKKHLSVSSAEAASCMHVPEFSKLQDLAFGQTVRLVQCRRRVWTKHDNFTYGTAGAAHVALFLWCMLHPVAQP